MGEHKYIKEGKRATSKRPFELVYRMEASLPINIELPLYKILQGFTTDEEALGERINELKGLDETRRKAYDKFTGYHEQVTQIILSPKLPPGR